NADAVLHVARQILDPGEPALIAHRFERLRHTARSKRGRASGRARRSAAPPLLVRRELEMRPQLLLEIRVAAGPMDRGDQALGPLAARGGDMAHRSHSSPCSSVCMIVVMRCHSAFSSASWRRPAAVML